MILAMQYNYVDEWDEILWTFSIYLEVVAMLPQLLMFRAFPCACCYKLVGCRTSCGRACNRAPTEPVPGGNAVATGPLTIDGLLWFYVLCMAMYRAFYVLNWLYRYEHFVPQNDDPDKVYWDPIVWVSGACQTSLFIPFFYHYINRFIKGSMPVK
jgi:ER lumen protein retaining receptor